MKCVQERMKELESYDPPLTKQTDHDVFWAKTIRQTREKPLCAQLKTIDYPIKQIKAYELTYHGFDDTPIEAFYLVPKEVTHALPCLIFFHGYGGHKHSISEYMKWLIQGYAVLAVDCRGQGRSGDFSTYSSDEMGSWVTKGILDKAEYYYRKVYMDGVRAIDFVCTRQEIDKERIAIMGTSMGGGITLAVAALDERPKLAVADIPNMCDVELAITLKMEGSLTYVEKFLERHPAYINTVFHTLSYFDNLNLSPSISCRVRMSAGLKDPVCPPESIFGVYNRLEVAKSMEVYPFSGHNVSTIEHIDKTIQYVNTYL
ncbi:acetylxylan esterase [Aquibacillus sp. 3ASR75-11]|uniref:Acetylxylan esterase n=1 Tax=Terrihalobacillus insolitus TaxID=2950438 RepID=A0A9X3WRH4_9BACI|nr:alpha/beta fold hydrolase [Terrihalobacillus insolitus]MDC3413821.1 acetylxylan esterase [Terrihalobacillus insolitus]MDC3424532.1 acetylxylan esterase [Terrihalobacillus insolitus]